MANQQIIQQAAEIVGMGYMPDSTWPVAVLDSFTCRCLDWLSKRCDVIVDNQNVHWEVGRHCGSEASQWIAGWNKELHVALAKAVVALSKEQARG